MSGGHPSDGEARLLIALARAEHVAALTDERSPLRTELDLLRAEVEAGLRAACGLVPPAGSGAPPAAVAGDVNDAVRRALPSLRRAAGDAVAVVLELVDDPGGPVRLPFLFDAVLAELVGNARDAIGVGGRVTIATRRDLSADGARVDVIDDGPGLSASALSRIFDPFYTTKAPGRGRGLGLAKARALVEDAGGALDVTSTLGGGSTFVLRLPAAAVASRRSA